MLSGGSPDLAESLFLFLGLVWFFARAMILQIYAEQRTYCTLQKEKALNFLKAFACKYFETLI